MEKARHDSAAGSTNELPASVTQHLWLVHGEWYDLKGFAAKHPGGRFWLDETIGLDITELYETHHLDMTGPDHILKKHHVGKASTEYQGFYDYKQTGLYCTLKRRVASAIKAAGGIKATPGFRLQCVVVLLAYCIVFMATAFTGSILYAALTGVLISALHGIGHNFLHQADSWWMWVCTVGGWNVHLNRVSHAISHHPMPNTEWDLEILGHEPWLYNMVDRPPNNKLVVFYGPLLCASGHLLDVLFTWCRVLRGKQCFELEMLTNVLQIVLLSGSGCGAVWGAFFVVCDVSGIWWH